MNDNACNKTAIAIFVDYLRTFDRSSEHLLEDYFGQKVNPDDYPSFEIPIEEEYFMTVIDRIFRFIEILESWLSF